MWILTSAIYTFDFLFFFVNRGRKNSPKKTQTPPHGVCGVWGSVGSVGSGSCFTLLIEIERSVGLVNPRLFVVSLRGIIFIVEPAYVMTLIAVVYLASPTLLFGVPGDPFVVAGGQFIGLALGDADETSHLSRAFATFRRGSFAEPALLFLLTTLAKIHRVISSADLSGTRRSERASVCA